MSDQEAQAPAGEPGVDDTPDAGTVAEPQVNWEERYKHLQGDYTRASQEAARYRSLEADLRSDDPEKYRAAAEAFGLQFADYEEDDEHVDPTESLRKEFDSLKASLETDRQKAQEEAELRRLETFIDSETASLGLDGPKKDWVISRALNLPWNAENGTPDIRAAAKQFEDELEAEIKKQWRNSKRSSHVSSVGASATQLPDLDDRKARLAFVKQQLAAEE